MRVVGGVARGRRLRAPGGEAVRPTTDRAREAIFDMLESLDAVDGAHVLDLFAGTGAMAVEALSRGAARAVLVEREPAALAVIEANLESTGLGSRARVHRGDVLSWLDLHRHDRADVAFCDPPYEFEGWDLLLERLHAVLEPQDSREQGRSRVALLESSRPVAPPPGWEVLKVRRYGSTVVTLVRPSPIDPKGVT